jgi:hypothetical protein
MLEGACQMSGFQERRVFSVDSAKAIKAQGYGYLNAIHYMAPADTAGVGNLCPHATPGCKALCLGLYSGQAAMVKDLEHGDNNVRRSRRNKARAFMADRVAYLEMLERQIRKQLRAAAKLDLTLVVRLNGSTDVAWERLRYGADRLTLLERFPDVQFVDYTKNPGRMAKAPANLSLTLSLAEDNVEACLDALQAGHNVAVIFRNAKPATWHGFEVIDGDKHDLRHLDPKGVVVGLTPKGAKAKADRSGMVQDH